MSYRLTTEEVKAITQATDMYVEAKSNYRTLVPVVTVPAAYTDQWGVLSRFEVPKGSKDGRDFVEVSTARTDCTANQISYRYKFNIPRIEVEMARRAGRAIWTENIQVGMKQMDMQIAHLIMQGNQTWDPVVVPGMRSAVGGGTNVDGTGGVYNAAMWNTATSAIIHIAGGSLAMRTAGFDPPFSLIMSWNLYPGYQMKYGAGDPSQSVLARDMYEINDAKFLPIGTSTVSRIYPIAQASSDDGCWFMFKKDPSVVRLAETGPPSLTLETELNREYNCYEGYLEWRGTLEVVQATGIQYNVDVDLA